MQSDRRPSTGGKEYSLGNWNLIKPGKKERNRKPYKEGRVVGVVSAVVILATIIPALPVAGAVTPVVVVTLTAVVVVTLTPVSVVPITPRDSCRGNFRDRYDRHGRCQLAS